MTDKNGHRQPQEMDERVLAYLEGALDAAEREAFEAELSREPELARALRAYEALEACLSGLGDAFRARTSHIQIPLDEVWNRAGDSAFAQANVLAFEHKDGAMRNIEAELESVGAGFALSVPAVDVRAAVLEKVRALESSVHGSGMDNIVPLRARQGVTQPAPKKQGSRQPLYAAAAVAAVLLLMFTIFGARYLGVDQTYLPSLAGNPAPDGAPEKADDKKDPLDSGRQAIGAVPRPFILETGEEGGAPGSDTGGDVFASITLDTVLQSKRNATLSTEEGINALAELKTWASMTPEEARRLLAGGGLKMEAILGVAQFLPPGEAAAVLEAQAQANPENPYIHYSLSALYAGLGNPEGSLSHLAALERQDPGNGMTPFIQAAVQQDQGNDSMSLALLLQSAESGYANTYALESANYRAQALEAQGFDPVVAAYLASLSAGVPEYRQIMDMTNEFIEFGQAQEQAEDFNAAFTVYDSLNQIGVNITENAEFTNEQLAGLDTQNAALTAIQGIVGILNDPVSMQVLEEGFAVFTTGLEQVGAVLDFFNMAMNTASPIEVEQYTQEIMGLGDIAFTENLAAEQ